MREIEKATAEYAFDNHEQNSSINHVKFSIEECRDFVTEQVGDFLNKYTTVSSAPIVVGISGGGDSNTLLNALINSKIIKKEQIIPVMVLGIPDWDKAIDRAKFICEEQGLTLQTISSSEVDKLLNTRCSSFL